MLMIETIAQCHEILHFGNSTWLNDRSVSMLSKKALYAAANHVSDG